RAVARHSASRARPGGAEGHHLSASREIRPFKFEFSAWVLTEDDRWSSMGVLIFRADSAAHDGPSGAPERVADRVDGT
ncbi:hypothetical protein BE221DRAFT_64620, partial [Ostreococcus tauri]